MLHILLLLFTYDCNKKCEKLNGVTFYFSTTQILGGSTCAKSSGAVRSVDVKKNKTTC